MEYFLLILAISIYLIVANSRTRFYDPVVGGPPPPYYIQVAYLGDLHHKELVQMELWTTDDNDRRPYITNLAQKEYLLRYYPYYKVPNMASSDHAYGTFFEWLFETDPEFRRQYRLNVFPTENHVSGNPNRRDRYSSDRNWIARFRGA